MFSQSCAQRFAPRALASCRRPLAPSRRFASSSAISNTPQEANTKEPESPSSSSSPPPPPPKTYFQITLTRSAIGLGERKKATLASLGIHRRMQTVFHPHKPEFAGKILAVKELVKVENVSEEEVRTKEEMRRMRRPPKGFDIVARLGEGLDVRA